ncbi:SGNH/GDSL hydrolase family protein [Ramlibacter sp. AN1015]|uniref:SGNH/GDSL hydrolase family protein n=1 Tax=Ramlibacter sp. AN1015 TaxID=3133428 RepID=UPI0030BBE672
MPSPFIAAWLALLLAGCGGGGSADRVIGAGDESPLASAPPSEPTPSAPQPGTAPPAAAPEPADGQEPPGTPVVDAPSSPPAIDPPPTTPGVEDPPPPALDPAPTVRVAQADGTSIAGARQVAADDRAFRTIAAAPRPWSADASFRMAAGLPSQSLKVSFVSDAPSIELRLLAWGNTQVEIRVDGVPVTATALRLGDDWRPRVVRLDFPAGARSRSYELFGRFLPFGGAWVPAGSTLTYPAAEDARPLVAFAPGDSYTQGSGAPSARQTYAGVAADELGVELWTEGVGGTGWLSGGAHDPGARVDGTLALLNKAPAIVVTALGYNDRFGDLAAVAARYDATVARIRAAWPQARIVTLGPWTPLGAARETQAMRELLIAGAERNGVTFIDLEGIVTAANMDTYTNADRVHPNAEGHRHLGRTIAARLRAAGVTP